MKIFTFFIIGVMLSVGTSLHAQSFLHKNDKQPVSFKEMQRRYDAWTKTVDLKREKGWKYWKRWEMDMQMHTDAQGNPGDPAIYIEAITQAAKEKQDISTPTF